MMRMNREELHSYVSSAIVDGVKVLAVDDGFLIQLPFVNCQGDFVEIGVIPRDDGIVLMDDIGYISGLLFELGEHGEESLGHLLTKRLINSYEFCMSYDEGVISKPITLAAEVEQVLDFIKVVISIETVLPFIGKPRKKVEGRKRLSARIGREISQLRLPMRVEKPARVEGKHEVWDIDYKYTRKDDSFDVLILTANLGLKEPKEKAAHIITLASDVLDASLRNHLHRELRVVYSVNGNESEAIRRAANLIDDYQTRIGYRAFNYSDPKDKSSFTSLTIQDLSPMKF